MFELEKAVDNWSKEFAGNTCGRDDRVEEMKDHLFCEIEENVKQGLNEESAFLAAIRRFGISEEMKAQFRSGTGIKAMLCAADNEFNWFNLSTKQLAMTTGAFLVIYAIITFGLAFLINSSEQFSFLSPAIYILIFVPVLFSVRMLKQSRAECAFVKRMIKKMF